MTLEKAIKEVLHYADIHSGLARGLKEVCQSLERGDAQLVILAEDCDNDTYVKLVKALCKEKGVYLIKVPSKADLGKWAGQVRLDAAGDPKKSCSASSISIKEFGEQSEGLSFLLEYIKENADTLDAE
mmetsp:Transcript_6030/g.21294  ORF Transcript_6030/g.21294 Transcript_6030/m.21294 type:complete len:128 (+) Transcript_6030:177-560(+)